MKCPVCENTLPTRLVIEPETKKFQCQKCTNWIMPTKKSVSKIKLVIGTFSFITGIPLGAFCSYLWLGDSRPWFSLYFLVFGSAAILLVVTLYSRKHLQFTLCQ